RRLSAASSITAADGPRELCVDCAWHAATLRRRLAAVSRDPGRSRPSRTSLVAPRRPPASASRMHCSCSSPTSQRRRGMSECTMQSYPLNPQSTELVKVETPREPIPRWPEELDPALFAERPRHLGYVARAARHPAHLALVALVLAAGAI